MKVTFDFHWCLEPVLFGSSGLERGGKFLRSWNVGEEDSAFKPIRRVGIEGKGSVTGGTAKPEGKFDRFRWFGKVHER